MMCYATLTNDATKSFTMTIEGRPDFTKDWQQEFYNQRRDRLADAVGEYITCDNTDARQCYEEMLAEIDAWIKYYRTGLDKATALKSLIMGNRDVSLEFLVENVPDRY